MDYSDDSCMKEFTQGQFDIMVAAYLGFRAAPVDSDNEQVIEQGGGNANDNASGNGVGGGNANDNASGNGVVDSTTAVNIDSEYSEPVTTLAVNSGVYNAADTSENSENMGTDGDGGDDLGNDMLTFDGELDNGASVADASIDVSSTEGEPEAAAVVDDGDENDDETDTTLSVDSGADDTGTDEIASSGESSGSTDTGAGADDSTALQETTSGVDAVVDNIDESDGESDTATIPIDSNWADASGAAESASSGESSGSADTVAGADDSTTDGSTPLLETPSGVDEIGTSEITPPANSGFGNFNFGNNFGNTAFAMLQNSGTAETDNTDTTSCKMFPTGTSCKYDVQCCSRTCVGPNSRSKTCQ
jgi:hypothetical protein